MHAEQLEDEVILDCDHPMRESVTKELLAYTFSDGRLTPDDTQLFETEQCMITGCGAWLDQDGTWRFDDE